MSIFKEFREFAMKGNMLDLAIGVIIGAAFGGLVNSMVNDIIMPPVGKLVGNLDFTNLYVSLSDKIDLANAERAQRVAATQPGAGEGLTAVFDTAARLPLGDARKLGPVIAYGNFITLVINFMIIAACIFMLIKALNTARKRFERQQAAAPQTAPADVQLLGEIRDILKAQQQTTTGV
jgi:large conductance mechanosensitive channel